VRLSRLQFRRNAAGGFRHDLDATLNAMTEEPILAIIAEDLPVGGIIDSVDCLENSPKRGAHEPLHQKIRSAEASIRTDTKPSPRAP
jgi:hypothetical protein